MEVILLEKIAKLGNLGDKVNVKSGFGRNFLIPYGKAVRASADNLADFEARKAELQAAADAAFAEAQQRAEGFTDFEITIGANAGEEGKLFGSIGTRDLADALTSAGKPAEKSEISMPMGVIRELGQYEIALQLHSDVTATFKVNVVLES